MMGIDLGVEGAVARAFGSSARELLISRVARERDVMVQIAMHRVHLAETARAGLWTRLHEEEPGDLPLRAVGFTSAAKVMENRGHPLLRLADEHVWEAQAQLTFARRVEEKVRASAESGVTYLTWEVAASFVDPVEPYVPGRKIAGWS